MSNAITAASFIPIERTLPVLRQAVQGCRGCELYRNATQAVFGEIEAGGRTPKTVPMMMIGEQPGDREDIEGHPFVGPAGKLLDRSLRDAGIDRSKVYLTNAVKHFKWQPRGKRRLHDKPTLQEVNACRPWLDAEIEAVHPRLLVCLGATAAQALLGPTFRVTQQRGVLFHREGLPALVATVHPSSILRARTDEDRHREMSQFVADLKQIAHYVEDLKAA
jgi:DNA polymerase